MNNLTEQTQTQWPSAPANKTNTPLSILPPVTQPILQKNPFFTNNNEKKKRKTKIKKHKQASKNKLNLTKKSKYLWKLNKFTR